MNAKTACVAVLASAAIACGGGAPTARRESSNARQAGQDEPRDAAADPNVLALEPGMLRDLRVTTTAVEERPGGDRITLLGELAVDQRNYAEVGAPAAARLVRLRVGEGEGVGRGAALAELTSPDLGRARAEYLSAQARVSLATTALERKRALAAERIAPAREVQEAESALASALAEVRSARAAIAAFGEPAPDQRDDGMSSTFTLRSPVGGSIIARDAVVGQMADPTRPLFRIGDLSTLWLTVHAFERDAVRIEPKTEARVAFAAFPGEDFVGRVRLVGRQVDPQSRTVDVRIDVQNPGGRLRPGMSATASVPAGASGARMLAVPVASVQRVREEWCVFVPMGEGRFEIRRIGRGRDLVGEVEVLSGLRAGDTVVVDGAFLLKAQAEQGAGDHDAH